MNSQPPGPHCNWLHALWLPLFVCVWPQSDHITATNFISKEFPAQLCFIYLWHGRGNRFMLPIKVVARCVPMDILTKEAAIVLLKVLFLLNEFCLRRSFISVWSESLVMVISLWESSFLLMQVWRVMTVSCNVLFCSLYFFFSNSRRTTFCSLVYRWLSSDVSCSCSMTCPESPAWNKLGGGDVLAMT